MSKLFAISDLHLCASVENKSMDVFGVRWERYTERLADNWQARVGNDDLVLVPGDISWAMSLSEAVADLEFLGRLNGQKLLLRGNHDYWWQSISQVLPALPKNCSAVQNNVFHFGRVCVGGTRGWLSPGMSGYTAESEKLFLREQQRLRLSLNCLPREGTLNVVMLHYPPFVNAQTPTAFAQIISEYPIRNAVYGHLHGASQNGVFSGEYGGTQYDFVSSDALDFCPKLIAEL